MMGNKEQNTHCDAELFFVFNIRFVAKTKLQSIYNVIFNVFCNLCQPLLLFLLVEHLSLFGCNYDDACLKTMLYLQLIHRSLTSPKTWHMPQCYGCSINICLWIITTNINFLHCLNFKCIYSGIGNNVRCVSLTGQNSPSFPLIVFNK